MTKISLCEHKKCVLDYKDLRWRIPRLKVTNLCAHYGHFRPSGHIERPGGNGPFSRSMPGVGGGCGGHGGRWWGGVSVDVKQSGRHQSTASPASPSTKLPPPSWEPSRPFLSAPGVPLLNTFAMQNIKSTTLYWIKTSEQRRRQLRMRACQRHLRPQCRWPR